MARKRNDAPMTLAQALRARMDRESLTQDDAASELGVSQSQVGRWLEGTTSPRRDNHAALMAFLDVDEEQLALLVHRNRRRGTSERLATLEERLTQIERALGISDG